MKLFTGLLMMVLSMAALADGSSMPRGDYTFRYGGDIIDESGDAIKITEVGEFTFDRRGMSGSGELVLLWMTGPNKGQHVVLGETFESNSITPDGYLGAIQFTARWSDGSEFERSVTYGLSDDGDLMYFQSTSPGTVAAGTAVKR